MITLPPIPDFGSVVQRQGDATVLNASCMRSLKRVPFIATALVLAALAAGCAKVEIDAPHLAPLPTEARMLLGKKQMTQSAPIFIRIFKAESELEVWKQRPDGHFYHFKTYPICHWSGELGPKLRQGDKQAPEGFYTVNRHKMNPNSKFHLSFDLGYPNAYDRANGRTGNFLMVHGRCKSAGCYAMTDGLMEEIYALAREAFAGGQKAFHVHAFPFRMTDENFKRVETKRNGRFWQTLKEAYDYFEITRTVPNVEICARRYHVNVQRVSGSTGRLNPRGACPRFRKGPVVAFGSAQWANNTANITAPAPRPAQPVQWSQPPKVRYHTAPSSDPIAGLLKR